MFYPFLNDISTTINQHSMRKEYRELQETVFPSTEKTISVIKDDNYGGAHLYYAMNCMGTENGETLYIGTEQQIRFVKKDDNGEIIPGLQSEQLVLILLDRHKNLNNRFPSEQNAKMIKGLEMFLEASKERVEDRIKRDVMGKLKN